MPRWSVQQNGGLRHFRGATRAWCWRSGVQVVRRRVPLPDALGTSHRGSLTKGGDQLKGVQGCGAQGSARLEALHNGLLMLSHVQVVGWEDLLESEDVAV